MRFPRVRLTVRRMMAVVALAGVALALADAARQLVAPSDWVDVTVRNVPPGLRQVYLIADGPDGPRALNWYFEKVFAFTPSATLMFPSGWWATFGVSRRCCWA